MNYAQSAKADALLARRRNPFVADLFLRWASRAKGDAAPSPDLQRVTEDCLGDARILEFRRLSLALARRLADRDVPIEHARTSLSAFFRWLSQTKRLAPWLTRNAFDKRWIVIEARFRRHQATYKIKRWRKERPEAYRAAVKSSTSKRRAAVKAVGKSFTSREWTELLRRHDERCFDCGTKKGVTVGHLVPLVHRIPNSNTIDFIIPQCARCNGKQFVSIHVEAVRRRLIDFDTATIGVWLYVPKSEQPNEQ